MTRKTMMDATQILEAVNAGQSIQYVPAGTYLLPSTFTGFRLSRFGQQVTFDAAARFVYPLGYSGPVFLVSEDVALEEEVGQVKVEGGQFWEAGTSNQWMKRATGIKVISQTSHGILENVFRDMWFSDIDVGIDLGVTTGVGFINNNEFQNIAIAHPQTYGIKGTVASALNTFMDITIEMAQPNSGANAVGVLVDGFRNQYINVSPEDASGTQSTGRISATARGCIIQGGEVNYHNFVDSSQAGAGNTVIP